MTPYKVWRNRTKRSKYNPVWLETISKTKTGQDLTDWIALILAWRKWTEDRDSDLWTDLRDSWKTPRRFSSSELRQFHNCWRLSFSPTIGVGQGLSHSNQHLFNKVKATLREKGEGKACWACGVIPSGYLQLNAHEFWELDYSRRIRKLKDVRFLCTDCHYLTHDANMMFLPLPTEDLIRLTELYCRVNECKLIEAYSYLTFFAKENHRETKQWTTDLSNLEKIVGKLIV